MHVCVVWVCVCKCGAWGVCDAWYGYVSGHLHMRESGWCACVCVVWVRVSVVCAIVAWVLCVCVCTHTHAHALLFSLACGPGASPSRATCPLWGFVQGEGSATYQEQAKGWSGSLGTQTLFL